MKKPLSFFSVAIILMSCFSSLMAKEKNVARFDIKKCSSGVDYPTKGDEKLKVVDSDYSYHFKILHPKVVKGPHFSIPFFWVEKKDEIQSFDDLISLPTHVGGLSWRSLNHGYFFVEKKGKLRGFMFEDGFDNADNGSSGLLFLYDGKKTQAWRWAYLRDPNKAKGHYEITSLSEVAKPAPKTLYKRLDEVLKLAEEEADAWPGP